MKGLHIALLAGAAAFLLLTRSERDPTQLAPGRSVKLNRQLTFQRSWN